MPDAYVMPKLFDMVPYRGAFRVVPTDTFYTALDAHRNTNDVINFKDAVVYGYLYAFIKSIANMGTFVSELDADECIRLIKWTYLLTQIGIRSPGLCDFICKVGIKCHAPPPFYMSDEFLRNEIMILQDVLRKSVNYSCWRNLDTNKTRAMEFDSDNNGFCLYLVHITRVKITDDVSTYDPTVLKAFTDEEIRKHFKDYITIRSAEGHSVAHLLA